MNIAICEDDAYDRDILCKYIQRYCNRHCYGVNIHIFESGEAFLSSFEPGAYDVIFMDIYMKGLNGIETAQKIRETDRFSTVVFITVSADHALDSYLVQAIYYVVKPLDEEKMEKTLFMCRNDFLKKSRFVELMSNRENVKVFMKDISYVESFEKATLIHTKDERVKTYTTLDELAEKLDKMSFYRCHRSFLVNLNYVDDIDEKNFIMKNGHKVPVRKNGIAEAKLAMANFMVAEEWAGVSGG